MPTLVPWLFFQAGWFLLVLAGESDWMRLIFPLLIIFLFLEKKYHRPLPKQYITCIALALVGCAVDILFYNMKLIQFDSSSLTQSIIINDYISSLLPTVKLIPNWLVLLWFLFALTLPLCYSWAVEYPKTVVLLAAILGPITYWGATRVSAAVIVSPVYFSLASMIFWGGLFGLIFLSPLKRCLLKKK